jgi:hypothetical protein
MSFPRYPTDKPSGVEWLGEVPEHWGIRQKSRRGHQRRRYIDALIAEQQRLIELLQEKRQAVISAAVTGQIDVRGLVPDAEAA